MNIFICDLILSQFLTAAALTENSSQNQQAGVSKVSTKLLHFVFHSSFHCFDDLKYFLTHCQWAVNHTTMLLFVSLFPTLYRNSFPYKCG